MKKLLLTGLLLGTMVLSSIGVSASTLDSNHNKMWMFDRELNGWTYQDNNMLAHDGLFQIKDDLYYFDSKSCVVTGWINWGNYMMYSRDDGKIIHDTWKQIDGKWYYFDNKRVMVTGTREIDGKTYNFASDGHLL